MNKKIDKDRKVKIIKVLCTEEQKSEILATMRHSPIGNSLMRFELAPAKEECKGWTHDDWKAFLDEFIAVISSTWRMPERKRFRSSIRN